MKRKVVDGLESVGQGRATKLPRRQYTRAQVAGFARVCKHTIARDVKKGLLREYKYNRRRIRYDQEDVAAYLGMREAEE